MTEKEYQAQYYIKNREKLSEKNKKSATKWRLENKERSKAWTEEYRQANREKIREAKRKWDRKAMKNPLHRLSNNMRGNMHHALKAKKDGRKWEQLAGYTLEDLIAHITPLLKDGMTWENYGEWHLDHIKPKSHFKYESTNDASFKECWALSNFQPLWKLDNIRKGNRFIG